MKSASIAAVCHAVNAAYCASLGDTSQPTWADAPEWQKASALAGVEMHIANPEATPEDSHESWLAQKLADGWKVGPVKDASKKEHPCCVPYADLPAEQKAKDFIFRQVVHSLRGMPDEAMPAPLPSNVPPPGSKYTAITYIGKRPFYRDGTYATGLEFAQGQTRLVPSETAALMLRHPDVYVAGEAAVAAPAVVVEAPKAKKDEVDDVVQQARDAVQSMNKDALAFYAKAHFQIDVDKSKKIGALRTDVTQLIDRFGVAD